MGLDHGAGGDADLLAKAQVGEAVAVNEIDGWRPTEGGLACGLGEPGCRHQNAVLSAGRRGIGLNLDPPIWFGAVIWRRVCWGWSLVVALTSWRGASNRGGGAVGLSALAGVLRRA
jgi:hypothetical protein